MKSASSTARNDALEEAAAFAEFYGEERMRMATDTILHDPVLAGGRLTLANLEASREQQIEGCINSSAYHAAKHIAEHLRKMKSGR